MRALLLLLCALPAFGQVREGETKDRNEGRALLLLIYNRPDVAEACRRNPDGFITVAVPVSENPPISKDFTVNCLTRRQYLELFDEMP